MSEKESGSTRTAEEARCAAMRAPRSSRPRSVSSATSTPSRPSPRATLAGLPPGMLEHSAVALHDVDERLPHNEHVDDLGRDIRRGPFRHRAVIVSGRAHDSRAALRHSRRRGRRRRGDRRPEHARRRRDFQHGPVEHHPDVPPVGIDHSSLPTRTASSPSATRSEATGPARGDPQLVGRAGDQSRSPARPAIRPSAALPRDTSRGRGGASRPACRRRASARAGRCARSPSRPRRRRRRASRRSGTADPSASRKNDGA